MNVASSLLFAELVRAANRTWRSAFVAAYAVMTVWPLSLDAATSSGLNLEVAAAGDEIEISWEAKSVTAKAPFLHYEFQIQTSSNLINWDDLGAKIPGGALASETVRRSTRIPTDSALRFGRVAYRLNLPGGDLSGLDLSGLDLRGSDLTGARLAGSSFRGSDLSTALLTGADLTGGVLEGANLQGADLNGATLMNVSLAHVFGVPLLRQITGANAEAASFLLPNLAYAPSDSDFATNHPTLMGLPVSVNTLIVRLNPAASVGAFNELLARHGASLAGGMPARRPGDPAIAMLRFPSRNHTELESLLFALEREPSLNLVVVDCLLGLTAIPDDTGAAADWIWESKPNGGNWGVEHIRAPQMWNLNDRIRADNPPNGPTVPTCVLDTGFWISQEDLHKVYRSDWWVNLITPVDYLLSSHGTHVSGIIAADWDNHKGIDGVNPFASLWLARDLPFFKPSLDILTRLERSFGATMQYLGEILADPEVRIVNVSRGYNWYQLIRDDCTVPKSQMEDLAKRQGQVFQTVAAGGRALIVSAAGNDNNTILNCRPPGTVTIEAKIASPWNYAELVLGVPNIIVVGAHDRGGQPLPGSDAGPDVLAPGLEILSTVNGEPLYDYKDGTSIAAPFVSGLAGYLLAIDPNLTPLELYQLLGANQQNIDAFRSVMGIDALRNNTRVLEMLSDIDDGTADGNTRLTVPPAKLELDRSFASGPQLGVTNEDEDADGDGGTGDGIINMADFRRWRDWLLFGEGNNALDGSGLHPKHDANRDGKVDQGTETKLYPRADFNGDGQMDRFSPAIVGGALGLQMLSDLDVLMQANALGFWADQSYDTQALPQIIDSVDIHVSAGNFFKKNTDITAAELAIYDAATKAPVAIGKPFSAAPNNFVHIFTVPVGKAYYASSQLISMGGGSNIVMRSIGDLDTPFFVRGADFAVDLCLIEMTAVADVRNPQLREIDSQPTEKEVDAYVPAGAGGSGTDSVGARAWANEEATLYALARAGSLTTPSPDPTKAPTFTGQVRWQRSFIKDASGRDPTFEVKPMKLRLGGSGPGGTDLYAMAEIFVESRAYDVSPVWKTNFHYHAQIAGHASTGGNPSTFDIVKQEGDLPPKTLSKPDNFSAEYQQEKHTNKIDLAGVQIGHSFEVRYRLIAQVIGTGVDTEALAYVGDPLDYGSGIRMEYGSFGELPRISGCNVDAQTAHVNFVSHSGFYYILYRTARANDPAVAVAMKLGAEGPGELIDPSPLPGNCADFYTVENFPLDQPLDTDKDGIDDVYELKHASFLNPLDPSDAAKDQDSDGLTNLAEYQKGTNPTVPDALPPQSNGLYPGTVVSIGPGSLLRAGDVNNDGRTDLVTISESFEGSLEVALGNPDGTFQNAVGTAITGSQGLEELLLARMDADDWLDAVTVDSLTKRVTVFRGLGNGRFEKLTELDTGGDGRTVAVGNINGDGKLDIVALNRNAKTLAVFLSQAAGGWQPATPVSLEAFARPAGVAIGQLNADSHTDLAVSMTSNELAVLTGNGDGSFGAPRMFSVGREPERVAVGDINGDGPADIITANKSSDDVSVLIGKGDGSFEPEKRYPAGDYPRGLVLEDVNGDNKLDLLVSHVISDFHSVLLNQGNRQLGASMPIHSAANNDAVVMFDWDGDRRTDLVALLPDGQALVLSGNGEGAFRTRSQFAIPNGIKQAEVADLGGDDSLEVIVLNQRVNALDVWEHAVTDGTSRLLHSSPVGATSQRFTLIDFNGDGKQDVVVGSAKSFDEQGENQLTLLRGMGDGTLSDVGKVALTDSLGDIIAGDVNSDGKADLVAVTLDGKLIPLLGDGAGNFQAEAAVAVGDSINKAVLADADGQPGAEVIVAGMEGPRSFVKSLHRSQSGVWSTSQTLTPTEQAVDLRVVDLTGDRQADVVVLNLPGLSSKWGVELFAGGTSGFGSKQLLLEPDSGALLAVADVNADSRPDLLVGSAIYLGKAGGGYESAQKVWLGEGGILRVADLNGDGKPDLLSWDEFRGTVGILLHR